MNDYDKKVSMIADRVLAHLAFDRGLFGNDIGAVARRLCGRKATIGFLADVECLTMSKRDNDWPSEAVRLYFAPVGA